MPKPVCVQCNVQFKPEKNDQRCIEMANFGAYKIWSSDKWKCPECGVEILFGFGNEALYEHFELDFKTNLRLSKKDGAIEFY